MGTSMYVPRQKCVVCGALGEAWVLDAATAFDPQCQEPLPCHTPASGANVLAAKRPQPRCWNALSPLLWAIEPSLDSFQIN